MKMSLILAVVAILVLNILLGAMSIGYLCETLWGKRPTFIVCAAIGVFTAELTCPAAVIAWGLRGAGIINVPLVKP